jgi:hypothetical protein
MPELQTSVTSLERTSASLVDVLDRVLDKGIVIDGWVRVSLVGIDLITVEMRIFVASIETYLKHADDIKYVSLASSPQRTRHPRLTRN